ncbi:MAG TPA: serine hydrolase domain-containing protein [Aeromicrobium sp.]|nr:serine hydrolase domain-containing protein [Aeromicrobium sp.]
MTVSGTSQIPGLTELLERNVATGVERGASICVIHDGEVLADVWGGWADVEATVPWERDTIVPVWSTSKVMTNLAALVLADRGLLDVEAPVATYWPEFAANGKESVTVTHVLSHSSGVSGWEQPVTIDDVFDWDKSTAMLAAQAPWWEPGSAPGYHLVDQGHLVGEVIRRITGDMPGRWFAREIAEPLGADFHIGLAAEHDHRVSPVTTPTMLEVDTSAVSPDGITVRTFTGPFMHASVANTERWRRAEIPAANGHGNARSVARIQALVSHGGEYDGVRLLSPETVQSILRPRAEGMDVVLNLPTRFGLGWHLPLPAMMPSVPEGRSCYWGGLGGSVVVNDLDRRLTIAYAMNRMIFEYAPGMKQIRACGDSRYDGYAALVEAALSSS